MEAPSIKELYDLGKPEPESDHEMVKRLTEEVKFRMSKKHDGHYIMDEIERASRDIIGRDGSFDCSKAGIGKKLFGFHDHDNHILRLFIGVLPSVNSGCLNIFTQKLSNMIYENGSKDIIIDIMIAFIVSHLKRKYSDSKEFVFTGTVESKNEGIITKR